MEGKIARQSERSEAHSDQSLIGTQSRHCKDIDSLGVRAEVLIRFVVLNLDVADTEMLIRVVAVYLSREEMEQATRENLVPWPGYGHEFAKMSQA